MMMIKTKINGNWNILLPKHRAERPDWYSEKGWERARLDSMHKHLGKGDKMCYVGAEEGEMPALCQMWGAEVYMIEPNPKVWPNIRAIWEANKLKMPLGSFIGFASNETNFYPENLDFDNMYKSGWPIPSYGEVIGDHGFRVLNEQADATPQIKIDDIGINFTAISLDVEGSEWRVLEGAVQTIKKYKPKIWLSGHKQFMLDQYDEKLGDLRRWIKEFGYKETLLADEHETHLYYE